MVVIVVVVGVVVVVVAVVAAAAAVVVVAAAAAQIIQDRQRNSVGSLRLNFCNKWPFNNKKYYCLRLLSKSLNMLICLIILIIVNIRTRWCMGMFCAF